MSTSNHELRQSFIDESHEHLDAAEHRLIELSEGRLGESEAISTVFREIHSIKGAAGAFAGPELQVLAHHFEDLLDGLRSGAVAFCESHVDLFLRCIDLLRMRLLDTLEDEDAARRMEQDVIAQLSAAAQVAGPELAGTAARQMPPKCWRVQVVPHAGVYLIGIDPSLVFAALAELGTLEVECDTSAVGPLQTFETHECHLRWVLTLSGPIERIQVEEPLSWLKEAWNYEISELESKTVEVVQARVTETRAASPTKMRSDDGSVRVGVQRIDEIMNLIGEVVITQTMLRSAHERSATGSVAAVSDCIERLEGQVRSLQQRIMQVRMLPASHLLDRVPRLVRDLSRSLGKDVDLKLRGVDTEIDKKVLEALADPLTHVVRNALDHGIETPERRVASGKERRGRLEIEAGCRGGVVFVIVRDDGAGLDTSRILEKAYAAGIVEPGSVPDEPAICDLIFHSGLSTADRVSDVSGRGVGMDVVRRNVEAVGGSVSVESVRGEGARFFIRLPLTLAIIDGQLVKIGAHMCVLPVQAIVESQVFDAQAVVELPDGRRYYRFRDENLVLVPLAGALDFGGSHGRLPVDAVRHSGVVVVVEAGGDVLALLVDELDGQQQVVVKNLHANYRPVFGVSAVTILGDGSVVSIVDIGQLANRAHSGDPAWLGAEFRREPQTQLCA